LGGLSKKGFQFNTIAHEAGTPRLTLDAGALLFKRNTLTANQEGQEKRTAAALVAAYDQMGYDAVCVGGQDLIAGLPYLREVSKDAKLAWLSANLVNQANNKPLFKASVTIKRGGIKVGVIGLTGPAPLPVAEEAVILPWDQVLPGLVKTMAKKHDLLILLSNLPPAENQRIAETYPDLALILQSGATDNRISPEPIGNTVIANTAPQGKYIGVMEISWQPTKRWANPKLAALVKKKADLEQVRWELSRFQQDKDPETALRNQPQQLQTYHVFLGQEQTLRAEIDQLSQAVGQKGEATGEPSTYRNRFVAMEKELPDQPEIVALLAKLGEDLKALGQRQAQEAAPMPANSPYLGYRACVPCHPTQVTAWQQSQHAQAYATLEREKQQLNPACLPCHVTGVALSQANEALSLPPDRRGVGCEVCHGPGRAHQGDPKANPMTGKPGAEICRVCHIAPHDPDFLYEEGLKKVRH